jgi:hypothetical protein
MLSGVAAPSPILAAGAAPALDGVKEIIIQPVQFSDPKAADACGLSRDDITGAVLKELQNGNAPVILASEAKPPMIGVARVDLYTQVYTLNSQDLDCASWIETSVTSKSNVVVLPIEVPRSVSIDYWRQGTIVATNQSQHQAMVKYTVEKMMQLFAKQYQVDQPMAPRQ